MNNLVMLELKAASRRSRLCFSERLLNPLPSPHPEKHAKWLELPGIQDIIMKLGLCIGRTEIFTS